MNLILHNDEYYSSEELKNMLMEAQLELAELLAKHRYLLSEHELLKEEFEQLKDRYIKLAK